MDTLLVVGSDTVIGANIAATLSDRYRVVCLATANPVSIAGCENAACLVANEEVMRSWIARTRPRWVVQASLPVRLAWPGRSFVSLDERAIEAACSWIRVASAAGCRVTVISSDAVLTGPRMFHDEDSRCYCSTPSASALRSVEQFAMSLNPPCLVVRTNAFGWSPDADGAGSVEQTLAWLQQPTDSFPDCHSYATPILASDLAEILDQAFQSQLAGLLHIAGAERVSPAQLVQRLAQQFGLRVPRITAPASLAARPVGFGCGDRSLRTRKACRLLSVAMPTLAEGLARVHDQDRDGYRERLSTVERPGKAA